MRDEPTIKTAYGFDRSGPKLGDVQLLENTVLGFQPLSRESLRERLEEALGLTVETERLAAALGAVSKAMNDRDLALQLLFSCEMRFSCCRLMSASP